MIAEPCGAIDGPADDPYGTCQRYRNHSGPHREMRDSVLWAEWGGNGFHKALYLTPAQMRTILSLFPNETVDIVSGRAPDQVHVIGTESGQEVLVGGVYEGLGANPDVPEAGCIGIHRDTYFSLPKVEAKNG